MRGAPARAGETSPQEPRTLRATFDDETVLVWQAHGECLADEIVRRRCLAVDAWRLDRTTRFRLSLPSLLARCAWGCRPGRERILGVRIARPGFEALLRQAVHAVMEPGIYPSRNAWHLATRYANVTVSWHPDLDLAGRELPEQTLRVGVRDHALAKLVREWVVDVEDWTSRVCSRSEPDPRALVAPSTAPYPLPAADQARLAGSPQR